MTAVNLLQGAKRLAPSGKPTSAILLLHGLGSNGDDLISLAPLLAPVFPNTIFISPNAPFAFDMAPHMGGYQWFSLIDRSAESRWRGVQEAAPALEQLIADVQKEFNLPAKRIVLMGFSQGCMMALHVAPRLAEPIACVVGLSGMLVGDEYLEAEIRSRPPVLLAHGKMDDVVPYAAMPAAVAALQRNNIAVESVTSPHMAHNIDDVVLTATAQFLMKHLGEG